MVTQTSGYNSQNITTTAPKGNYYTLFHPENGQIKATVLVLHGMQEHSGRYTEFAEFLADAGYAVMVYDHLGHGKTAGTRDDLGFFQIEEPVKKIVNDAENMASYLEWLFPSVPHFILGHSMGSFITRCVIQNIGSRFSGAIIVGTGGKTKGIKFLRSFLSMKNQFAPRKRSHFVNSIFGKKANDRFKAEQDPLSWLSVNKANRQAFLQDELCGVDFTNNAFYTLFSIIIAATNENWTKSIPAGLPILFVSGADDPVGDFSKGVEQAAGSLREAGFRDVTVKLYNGMRHEIFNEDIKLQVYAYVEGWVAKHI